MFDILVSDITRIVKAKEKRGKRNEQSYQDLTNAVRYLLKILWEDSTSIPVRACSPSKTNGGQGNITPTCRVFSQLLLIGLNNIRNK